LWGPSEPSLNVDNQKYDDDEPIKEKKNEIEEEGKEKVKPKAFDLEKDLKFGLKSMTKAIKLSSEEVQYIPAMISLETNPEKEQEVDLD
jgi:hypothetical protein